MFLKGYDFIWTDPDEDGESDPILYATFELTDEEDIQLFGSEVITMPVDVVRLGICYPCGLHTDTKEEHKKAFSYERQLFDEAMDYLEFVEDDELRGEESEEFLGFIHANGTTRTIGSIVAVRLKGDRYVRVWQDEDRIAESAVFPEWYELKGVVNSFLIHDIGDSGEEIRLTATVLLDVVNDHYFTGIGVSRVEIPLNAIDGAVFLGGPNFN